MSRKIQRDTFVPDEKTCESVRELLGLAYSVGGWTKGRLVKLTGFRLETLNEYEAGLRLISFDNLRVLGKIFQMSETYILRMFDREVKFHRRENNYH